MQPKPIAETSRPLFPNLRFCMMFSWELLDCARRAPPDGAPALLSLVPEGFLAGASADHRDLSKLGPELKQLLRCDVDGQRAEVLVEVMELRRAGDWNDEGTLGQKPGQRELDWSDTLSVGP